jgi:hypothetical protein
VDEQCPALHACREGVCVEADCQTDRECVFMTGDVRSACRKGACSAPCDADSDCGKNAETGTDRFEVCAQGECVFVGCENDAECRALLGLVDQPTAVRAVCR